VLPFPFSDLSATKKCPALVIADVEGDDPILCQITSNDKPDPYIVSLNQDDLKEGKLKRDSLIRTNKLFTVDIEIIIYEAGKVTDAKMDEVIDKLISLLGRG
jgi:mRNA interferase MazF